MAGGKGSRLMPLTKNIPKPLLKIKGVPIIEKIILNFIRQGFKNFIISVNYLGHKIKKYLGNGERFKININYINEKIFRYCRIFIINKSKTNSIPFDSCKFRFTI